MQTSGMTLVAQMEERKLRSLSYQWAKLLHFGTGLQNYGVSVINNPALWQHILSISHAQLCACIQQVNEVK